MGESNKVRKIQEQQDWGIREDYFNKLNSQFLSRIDGICATRLELGTRTGPEQISWKLFLKKKYCQLKDNITSII